MSGKQIQTLFWLEYVKERDHVEHPVTDGKDNIKKVFKKENGIMWTAIILLTIGTNGGLL